MAVRSVERVLIGSGPTLLTASSSTSRVLLIDEQEGSRIGRPRCKRIVLKRQRTNTHVSGQGPKMSIVRYGIQGTLYKCSVR